MANLWDNDNPVTDLGIDVPRWIDQDISPCDVAAINQGGCESGAYMPAVTYYQALETMNEYGDEILDYCESQTCEANIWNIPKQYNSWAGVACYFVSLAVELWAASVEDEISDELDNEEGSNV